MVNEDLAHSVVKLTNLLERSLSIESALRQQLLGSMEEAREFGEHLEWVRNYLDTIPDRDDGTPTQRQLQTVWAMVQTMRDKLDELGIKPTY